MEDDENCSLEVEFPVLESKDADKLWQTINEIESFYRENRRFFEQLNNEVDNMYTKEMTSYVIDSAMTIRTTLRCPTGWKEGLPWINMFPPAPQPEQMRYGVLASLTADVQSMNKSTPGEDKEKFTKIALSLRQRLQMKDNEADNQEDEEEEEEEAPNVVAYGTAMDVDIRDNVPLAETKEVAISTAYPQIEEESHQIRRSTVTVNFGNFGDDSDEESD